MTVDRAPVEQLYRAFVARDWESLASTLGPDATLDFAGKSRFAGSHRGREAVTAVFRGLAEASGGTMKPKLADGVDVCVSNHHAVLMDWFEATRGGHEVNFYVAFVIAVEDGHCVRLFPFFEDQYVFDGFFAPEQV